LIQDKYKQKLFYQANKIPTAPFHYIDNPKDLNNFVAQFPMVQKLCKGGYDGKGVHILKSDADLAQAFQLPSILEEKIPFLKELSVIIARNEKGEMVSFPCVEQEFNPQANLVEFLFSPADVSPEIENKAVKIAETIIEQLDMIGLLAVELFLTADGELLVNEIAPRPHNSGHHTIEANYESQF
jgi:5-(carboxyamino)imidazole ribonucleotide synthase